MFLYMNSITKQPTFPKYIRAQRKLIPLETNINRQAFVLLSSPTFFPKTKCVHVCVRAVYVIPRLCRALQQVSTPHQGNVFHSEKLHQ